MPVYKYKTFEEAEQAQWCFEPDEAYFKRVERLLILGKSLLKIERPRGVFKFKTIEEANQHREALERAHLSNQ